MFQRLPEPAPHTVPLSVGTRYLLWTVTGVDVMTVVWMIQMGDWLDSASPLLSVITLGGHHRIVLGLALAGFLLLAGLAPLTQGFFRASRTHSVLIPIAGVLSVVAFAGLLSVIAVAATAVLVVALLFGGQQRARIDVFQRR